MLQRLLLVISAMLLLAGLAARPDQTLLAGPDADCGGDFRPLADAAVDQSAADTALGEAGQLQVRAASRDIDSLLYFDVLLDRSVTVHSARLELTVSGGSLGRDAGFLVSNVLEPWAERSVTWNNQPRFRPGVARTSYALERDKLSLDVTTLVRAWQAGPDLPQSFIIQGLTEGMDVTFYSREETDAALQPRMTIRCDSRR
ncbi:MAG: DNRLRE domain-containing protein, partial [Chloroflexota bacterium]